MSDELIAKRVHEVAKNKLDGVPFDKGLPILRNTLWDIAEEIGTTGDKILKIYLEWLSKNN